MDFQIHLLCIFPPFPPFSTLPAETLVVMSARWGQVAPRSWARDSLHSHCFHCASPCELPQWAEQKFSWKTYDVRSFTEKATTKKQVKKRKEKQRTKGMEKNQTTSEIAGKWISICPSKNWAFQWKETMRLLKLYQPQQFPCGLNTQWYATTTKALVATQGVAMAPLLPRKKEHNHWRRK